MAERVQAVENVEQVAREIERVLIHEAELLDTGQFEAWLAMMAEDLSYEVPVRVTRQRGAEENARMHHMWDNLATLSLRVKRLSTDFAWSEDPPSRTRHFVSNVRVAPLEPGLWDVKSYLLLLWVRGDNDTPNVLSGERHDIWRQVDGQWQLSRRRVLLDQALLNVRNLSIFV